MKIKIGFFAIFLFLTLMITNSAFFLASVFAVLLHELGHILMARLCRIRLYECSIGIFGAGITPADSLYSYSREILLCLAGPLMNFLTALFVLWFFPHSSYFVTSFLFASFSLGLLNLLPIHGFDGGRIFHSLFSLRFSPTVASCLLSSLSFIFIFLLWALSVYFLLRARSSLSLFVFSLSLFARIFLSEK